MGMCFRYRKDKIATKDFSTDLGSIICLLSHIKNRNQSDFRKVVIFKMASKMAASIGRYLKNYTNHCKTAHISEGPRDHFFFLMCCCFKNLSCETPKSKIPLLPLVAMVFAIVFLLSATKAPKGQRSPQYLIAGGILIAGLIGWNGLVWETSAFSSAPPPEQEEAAAVFESLLGNVYRAFDYRDEEAIYDALANSVGGPYLDSVYLEIFNGLQMTEQGGARSRVREVRIQKATPVSLAPNSYGVDCQWTIEGSVEHWGHVHTRKNLFAGRFAVQVTDGHWRITGLDLSNQERLQFETSLRDFN